jgi:hypothetical protein
MIDILEEAETSGSTDRHMNDLQLVVGAASFKTCDLAQIPPPRPALRSLPATSRPLVGPIDSARPHFYNWSDLSIAFRIDLSEIKVWLL